MTEKAKRIAPSFYSTKYQHIRDRLRGLSIAEQHKAARSGQVNERVALERIYGSTVWEALLKNPEITIPEVARIARMESLPRQLIDFIVEKTIWISAAPVRRALLSNPRMSSEQLNKVLQIAPKSELMPMPRQTAYPGAVRSAVRRFLG